MLQWDDFRIYLAIARERTLTGAARRLGVDQSTMSRRLMALQASAETKLFDRTPDGYVPTAAGEALRAPLEDIERRAQEVERLLVGHDARVEGRVRLATSDSFAAWFVVRHLRALGARHPGLVIEIATGNRPADLSRRDADVSLRLTAPTDPNLVARRLGRAAWALYGSASYVRAHGMPVAGARLAGHDVVGYADELAGTTGARWLQEHGSAGHLVTETNSLLTQAAAVMEGLGVSTLPCLFGDTQKSLRRLPPGLVGHHDLWLVVHPDVRSAARVRAVIDFFVERITSEAALLAGDIPQVRHRGSKASRSASARSRP